MTTKKGFLKYHILYTIYYINVLREKGMLIIENEDFLPNVTGEGNKMLLNSYELFGPPAYIDIIEIIHGFGFDEKSSQTIAGLIQYESQENPVA